MATTGGGTLRWMSLTVSCVAVAVAVPLVWMSLADDDAHPPLPGRDIGQHPTPTTVAVPRSYPTTTTIPAERIEVAELPGGYDRVVATTHGTLLATGDASLPFRQLTYTPTKLAFGAGDGRVVLQEYGEEESGRIVVLDAQAEHEVYPGGSSHGAAGYELHDVAYVGGRPYAVVATYGGDIPSERDVRIVLVDLETLRRLDLGSVAGDESWVGGARLLPDGDVILLVGQLGGDQLERRRLDGTRAWAVPLEDVGSRTLVLDQRAATSQEATAAVLEPSIDDEDLPRLVIRRFDLETGLEEPTRLEHVVDLPDGVEPPWSFCSYAEVVGPTLLCDQAGGAPVRIDVVDGTARPETGAPPYGRMTLWRFASGAP